MAIWGSSSGWGVTDEPAPITAVENITSAMESSTINDVQPKASDEPASGEPESGNTFRNPQEHGWSSKTATDYVALAADRDSAAALEEADVIPTWYVLFGNLSCSSIY